MAPPRKVVDLVDRFRCNLDVYRNAMTEPEIGARIKIHCNACKGLTHHELQATHTRCDEPALSKNIDEGFAGFEEWEYRFWVCRGCDTATLEVAYTNTGMLDVRGRENVWESTFYPKRKRRDCPLKRFRKLDERLARIYREVVESFNSDSRILCAMGLRALLEGICADRGITGKNLKEKIDNLKEHLPSNIIKGLHSFRFMGNEAAHELQIPQERELRLAVEVMEDLLNFLYEMEYRLAMGAERLAEGRREF